MTAYGYCRVSTPQQEQQFGLELQKSHILVSGSGVLPENIICETGSGRNSKERPLFRKLIDETLQKGDVLVVAKLDRFSRSLREGLEDIKILKEKGVELKILDLPLLDNTPASELIVNMYLAFAQYDRAMTVERMKQGRAIAKTKNGFKEGRKPIKKKVIEAAMKMLETESYNKVSHEFGIAKSTLLKYRQKYEKEGKFEDKKNLFEFGGVDVTKAEYKTIKKHLELCQTLKEPYKVWRDKDKVLCVRWDLEGGPWFHYTETGYY